MAKLNTDYRYVCLGGKVMNKMKNVMITELRLLLGRVQVSNLKLSRVSLPGADNVLFLDMVDVGIIL